MTEKIPKELLNIFESLLRAQLNTVKQLKKASGIPEPEQPEEKCMSHMDMVYDILNAARAPMHVNDIIIVIEKNFNVEVDKESLVSALAKRVLRQDRFVKTAPNTFALISHDVRGGNG